MNALDRNWHWVIVLASFLCHVICDGITYAFGIMNEELLHHFGAGVALTSWVTSILIGITLGFGPIAGSLANHFGCRKVVIAGSILAAIGSFASCFATNLIVLFITVGVVMGAGFSLMFCPSVIIVNLHFQKRRALAVGMVVCGAGIGTFIFAPLTVYLIENYTWRGTFIVYSGFILNGVVFGCIYRDPPEQKVILDPRNGDDGHIENHNNVDHDYNRGNINSNISYSDRNLDQPSYERYRNRCFSLMTVEEYKGQIAAQLTDRVHTVKPLERKDIFYSGFALDEDSGLEVDMQIEVLPRKHSTFSKPSGDGDEDSNQGWISDMVAGLERMMDLSLLKDPVYLTIALSNFLTNLGYDMPRIFLPDKVHEEMGVSKSDASWLLSIWGITSTIGRLLIGAVCDHKWAIPHRLWIYNISLGIAGVVNILAPFLPDYTSMAVYSAIFGLSLSTYISLTSVVLVDVLGIDKLTNAFGLLLFFQGVSAVIGPPIGGAIVDASGTYDYSFIFAGIALVLSGLVLVPIALQQRARHKHRTSTRHHPTLASIPE